MQIEKRNISELQPNPINVRRHNKNQINEFKKSITKFGVLRPIVIDENNVILAGHGLYEALKESEKESADVIVMKGLSENEKKKLLLADNKIYSLGTDDYTAIETILSDLGQLKDFEVPGYDSDVLEDLYGISSIENEIEQSGSPVNNAIKNMQEEATSESTKEEINQEDQDVQPSRQVQQARQEAKERKFVVCPNCGEKIWL